MLFCLLSLACTVPPQFSDAPDGGAATGQVVISPTPNRDVRIAILPDRTTGRDWGLAYLDAAVEDLNRLKPDAVFCVGDLVQGYTRRPEVWKAEADDYLKRVAPLTMPWYPTAGNHDVISGARDPSDRQFARMYREVFGPLWYAVELNGLTVLVLFSDENSDDRNITLGDAQLAWLTDQLERTKAHGVPSVLLMHRPLWKYASVGWDTRVHPLLATAGTVAVIAGHFHALQRAPDRDGVQYHILGTCGGAIDQHPLTGQLQHLSFLDLTHGAASVWHQFAGATLPDDFVVVEDQERVFRLTRSESGVAVRGALPEPGAKGFDAAPLSIVVHNPLDRPVTARVLLRQHNGEEWIVPGEPSVSRTLLDTYNPAVTDRSSPVTLTAPERTTIAAGADATIELRASCPPQPAPLRAPEAVVELTFTDSRGREVPVSVRRRLPVQRTLEVQVPGDARVGAAMPLEEWSWTPYATDDAPPMVSAMQTPAGLLLTVLVPDDRIATAPQRAESGKDRTSNPMVDALAIRLHQGDALQEWIWEPATGALTSSTNEKRLTFVRHDTPIGWSATCMIPWSALTQTSAINIGVADNDDTFHTQWRWLSPNSFPATLRRTNEVNTNP